MRQADIVCGEIKQEKLMEHEYLIYTLASLPELVYCHGWGILKKLYEGTFDEADLGNEEIPEWYQSKIRFDTLGDQFFRDLLFSFYMVDDFDYICEQLRHYIRIQSCSEQVRKKMLLEFYGIRYLIERKMPWEIESYLFHLIGENRNMEDVIFIYQQDRETMVECIRRYEKRYSGFKENFTRLSER